MNRKTLILLIMFILLMTLGSSYIRSQKEVETEAEVETNRENSYQAIIIEYEEIKRPEYDIPLSIEIQDYIWELSNEYEISYELVLAVIHTESSFDIKAINKNRNGTSDRGLMQINSAFQKYHAKNAGVEKFDPYNPFQNVKVGIGVLVLDRNYWRGKGLSEEDVYYYAIGSYNYGKKGVKKYGLPWDYINKVSEYKFYLETLE